MKIIGMDLGTSNTYIYASDADGTSWHTAAQMPAPVPIPKISDDSGSIATVVMYENGQPLLAGNIAESEFYSNLEAQPRRELASQFKPEISQGEPHAIKAMTDFLAILRQSLQDKIDSNTRVFVGMPSLARADYPINLTQCFINSGWPKPLFVRESDAALISCLQSGTLDVEDLERKCLILDFGGGTCDYTTIENMDVLQNGGDCLYGGRLFDDLFFQVFCRYNSDFAAQIPKSPYAWYVHWVECKAQKEKFSDFSARDSLSQNEAGNEDDKTASLHAVWFDAKGGRHDAFVNGYTCGMFIGDCENFQATPQLLGILDSYKQRGGLSGAARDMLAEKRIGLISWLKNLLLQIENPSHVARVIITGGSSRWFFVRDIVNQIFSAAICMPSARNFEDIAFGLALYPLLQSSRERVQKLLDEKLPDFSTKLVGLAADIMRHETSAIIQLCSERIVSRDIMPVLASARESKLTVAEIEKAFDENIKNDDGLLEIARLKSENMRETLQNSLNYALRNWLRENGVLLLPNFQFPVRAIGKDFFDNVSVRISRLDSLNIMHFTLTTILPFLIGTTTGGVIIHSGEPISALVGGALAGGAAWLAAKTAPRMLAGRQLPSVLLTEKNQRKIAEKNREYIEEIMKKSLDEIEGRMLSDMETRLTGVLTSMLGRLTVLNQVRTEKG